MSNEIDYGICPYCGDDDNTTTYDEWLSHKVMHCEACNQLYDVWFESKVRSVEKRIKPERQGDTSEASEKTLARAKSLLVYEGA